MYLQSSTPIESLKPSAMVENSLSSDRSALPATSFASGITDQLRAMLSFVSRDFALVPALSDSGGRHLGSRFAINRRWVRTREQSSAKT